MGCVRPPAGPLFNFDVHDDVRLLSDATVEKDEVRWVPAAEGRAGGVGSRGSGQSRRAVSFRSPMLARWC